MTRTAAVALLLMFRATSLFACDLHVRAVPPDAPAAIAWDHYVGAASYLVTETRDGFITSRTYSVQSESFTIPHRVSETTRFEYRVQALFDPKVQTDNACRGTTMLELQPDPAFRRLVRKAIVPVVGSVVGATGAKFRTALRITSNVGGEKGRIVFHPAGQASESDPFIRYAFTSIRQTMAWDDIVAAIGATGIGTLDVIPDDDAQPAPPLILARHYTDAPGGTFGSFEPAVYPFDYLRPPALEITIPEPRFRVNIGVRTLAAVNMSALIFATNGHVRAQKTASFGADTFTLVAASQLLGDLAPGETVTIAFDGPAVPFYTLTENGTNDPAVVLPGARETLSSFFYVE